MSGTGSVTAFVPGATLSLTGTNTFTGGLTVANGTVQIGSNPAIAGATVAGTITNYSALYYSRSDAFTNINTVTSAGNTREYGNGDVYIRGAGGMTVNGTAPISAGGNLNVGATLYGKLTLNSNANVTVANTMNIGDSSGIGGDEFQNAGTVNVNGYGTVKILSIGLWGSEISSYNMYGGILNVPNATIDVCGLRCMAEPSSRTLCRRHHRRGHARLHQHQEGQHAAGQARHHADGHVARQHPLHALGQGRGGL